MKSSIFFIFSLSLFSLQIVHSQDPPAELSLPKKLSPLAQTYYTDFLKILKGVHLFESEIMSLFNLIDKRHEGRINQQDWGFFYKNFIEPFEKECDKDKDYLLSESEVGECLKSEKLKDLPVEIQDSATYNVTSMLSKDNLNLNDYVFLRRSNLAWNQCSFNGQMSKMQLVCAFNVLVPVRSLSLGEAQQVFNNARLFRQAKTTNSQDKPWIDFPTFLSAGHTYSLFDQFDNPIKDGSINKYDLLKQINYQRMPVFMSYETVEQIFMSYDPDIKLDLPIHLQVIDYQKRMARITSKDDSRMDFIVFNTYFTLHNYFRQFSKELPGYLSLKEFQDMAKIPAIFPPKMLDALNALEFPDVDITAEEPPPKDEEKGDKMEKGQKATLLNMATDKDFFLTSFIQTKIKHRLHNKQRLRNRQFVNSQSQDQLQKQQKSTSLFSSLFQFTQKKTKSKAKAKAKKGGDNSEKIFNMFDSGNKGQMQFLDMIRLFKYCWLFLNYDLDEAGFLTEQKVEAGAFTFVSPIPISVAEQQIIEKITENSLLYKFVDLKVFLSMFIKWICFYDDSLNVVDNQAQIHEQAVIQGLTKLGLNIYKEQIAQCLDGVDDLGVDQYNKNNVYKQAIDNEKKIILERVKKAKDEKK